MSQLPEMHEIELRWTVVDPDLSGYLWGESSLEFSVGEIQFSYDLDNPKGPAFVLITSTNIPGDALSRLLEWEAATTKLNALTSEAKSREEFMELLVANIPNSPELSTEFESVIESFEIAMARLSGWITWREHMLPPQSDLIARMVLLVDENEDPYEVIAHTAIEYRLPPNMAWRELPTRSVPSNLFAFNPPQHIDGGLAGRNQLLSDLQNESNEAPLAWSMFQSAVRASEDRKLSTVFAVSAAEVAVKRFLVQADQSQLSEWLLVTKQAPRWRDLVKQALPLVTERRVLNEPTNVLPKSIWVPIDKCMDLRNNYVHSGVMNISHDEYQELMFAVNDLLYALEWMRGEEWAFQFISSRSKESWIELPSGE